MEDILKQHAEVFEGNLGILKGFTAQVHIDPAVTLRFCRS